MTNEKKDRSAVVVFVVFAGTAGMAFAIQAWMTFGFADEVWKIPEPLAVALIVALDLFAVMFMVLSYLLRGAGWPRFIASAIFIFAIGAQVAAAEMFGEHKDWPTEIRVFAALPALLLAASQEGVILWRTYAGRAAELAAAKAAKQASTEQPPVPREDRPRREKTTPAEQAAGAAPVRERPARPVAPPQAPPPSSGNGRKGRRGRQVDPAEQARRDHHAANVIRHGGDAPAKRHEAEQVGVSVKSIENWMTSYRQRHPDDAGPTNAAPQINGKEPQLMGEVAN